MTVYDTDRFCAAGNSRNVDWRKNQLRQLGLLIQENETAITEALKADLNRPAFETITAETVRQTFAFQGFD